MRSADVGRRQRAERSGRRGEDFAALLLTLKFYRIMERRQKSALGEIDLIARSPSGIICFIEVKLRKSAVELADAVTPRQRARIARAAQHFLSLRPWLATAPVRFDIVTVGALSWPRHVRDAWRPDDPGLWKG